MKTAIAILTVIGLCIAARAARVFNGTSQGGTIPSALDYPFTISFWAYPLATNNNFCPVAIQSNATAGGRLLVGIVGSSGFSGAWRVDAGGSTDAQTGALAQPNVWQHVAVTAASPSNRTIWVNGTAYGPNTVSNATRLVPQSINIGQRWLSGFGQYWTGRLAEVAIWNSVLANDVIAALAAGKRPDNAAPTAPILYLPMFGTTATENSLAGTIGAVTLSNTPTIDTHPPTYR